MHSYMTHQFSFSCQDDDARRPTLGDWKGLRNEHRACSCSGQTWRVAGYGNPPMVGGFAICSQHGS